MEYEAPRWLEMSTSTTLFGGDFASENLGEWVDCAFGTKRTVGNHAKRDIRGGLRVRKMERSDGDLRLGYGQMGIELAG
jgi:hypothetical protein